MATQKERFLSYLQTCVKSTRSTDSNPLFLGGNAPKDYARFLEPDRLFDYNPSKWDHIGSMYDINDYSKALEIFNELIADNDFLQRDNVNNQGWRRGAISHYVCFLSAQKFFLDSSAVADKSASCATVGSLQRIYYGAPGTGKSHTVDETTSRQPKENVFRTTFHPDSDYSTFVGCYKPTKKNGMTKQILDWKDLVEKLKEYRNKYAETDAQVMFGCEYYQSLRGCENLGQLLEDAGGKNYDTYIKAGMKVAEDLNPRSGNSQITYEFVPQVFTKAYVRAHQTDEPVFLVIEEINRGNCAQIFGDIFQLLDRDENGVSNYAVKPDSDLEQYLIEHVKDYKPEEGMRLPKNLYIWATMNTSDQSLFPIDSAFKCRWDWTYVPINTEQESGWVIDLGADGKFSWSSFLKLINERIFETTSSEDKQLGFYFCKAEEKNISAEKFVGKVLFFIYNDVFKDYDYSPEFFKAGGSKTMPFHEYFNMDGSINIANVAKLLKALAVESVVEISNDDEDDDYVDSGSGTSSRDQSTYSINGKGSYKKAPLVGAVLTEYVNSNKTLTLDEIKNEWNAVSSEIGSICPANFIETETEFEDRVSKSSDANVRKRANKIEWDGNVLYVTSQWNIESITKFVEVVNAKPWGIKIEKL